MPSRGTITCRKVPVLDFSEIYTFVDMVKEKLQLEKIKITGGEPLIRRNLPDLIRGLISLGIEDVSLTTNGQLLDKYADGLAKAGLKRINLSLDSINPMTYSAMTGSNTLKTTLQGIERIEGHGLFPIKINCVVLRTFNFREMPKLLAYCISRGWQIRFLELMPIGLAVPFFNREFVSTREVQDYLQSQGHSLRPDVDYTNQIASNYFISSPQGNQGKIGFISSQTGAFCHGCTRLRLTADGRIIPCLMQNFSADIRPFLKNNNQKNRDRFSDILDWAFSCKKFNRPKKREEPMVEIGG
jgi:cyclic pyranopterin phosphate synthase